MKNKVALITGASRGIGAATARLLGERGFDIAINYHQDKASAESLLLELQSTNIKAIAIQADVADESQVLDLYNTVDQQLGRLSVLINNAGILKQQTTMLGLTAERINQIFATNVTGYFLCAREAIKRMSSKAGGAGGVIINVSSVAAKTGSPFEYIDYAASKGAIDTMTRGLSVELAAENIRVNAVRPGFINTDMHADGGEPNRIERLRSVIPMARGGEATEVASAIAWLVSDEASYVTGSFIDVAGGR